MKTGGHLKIEGMGDNVLGVRLLMDTRKPEPIHFRVVMPFGCIDIVRRSDGRGYWIHIIVNHPEDGHDPERVMGRVSDARIHMTDKHSCEADLGDFGRPSVYDVALLVERLEVVPND